MKDHKTVIEVRANGKTLYWRGFDPQDGTADLIETIEDARDVDTSNESIMGNIFIAIGAEFDEYSYEFVEVSW